MTYCHDVDDDNDNNKNIASFSEKSNTLEYPTYFERISYTFDYPQLTGFGHADIFKNSIVISFPEKQTQTQPKSPIPTAPLCSVFINHHLKFSMTWLPIYTHLDYYKFKELFWRVYQDYIPIGKTDLNESIYQGFENYCQYPTLYTHSNIFKIVTKTFNIQCYEDKSTTVIEINTYQHNQLILPDISGNTNCKDIQIYIGNNKVLCSERDFACLTIKDKKFLILFILYKILK